MNILKSSLALASMAVLLAACSSTPTQPMTASAPAAEAAPATAPATTAAVQPAPASAVAPVMLPAYLDPANPISRERSVYFAFDDFAIPASDSDMLSRHGQFLSMHGDVHIKVEGNADERGSAEYNLALGQKRAQAVVQALSLLGVKPAQMEAISWGEEKPKALGHDEAAWSQNRRADLVYPAQ